MNNWSICKKLEFQFQTRKLNKKWLNVYSCIVKYIAHRLFFQIFVTENVKWIVIMEVLVWYFKSDNLKLIAHILFGLK